MGIERINPPGLASPSGFTHVVSVEGGRLLFVAGVAAQEPDGSVIGGDFVAQFDRALANLVEALAGAGARPEHVTKMTIYATDPDGYTASRRELGRVWRERMGKDYPAMTFVGVTRLWDPAAVVELDAFAVVP